MALYLLLSHLAVLFLFCTSVKADQIDRRFPSLIVPIHEASPDAAGGTQFSGVLNRTVGQAQEIATEVSFDVPANGAVNCSIGFFTAVPDGQWSLRGDDPMRFDVFQVNSTVNKDTDSWSSHPAQGNLVASVEVRHSGEVSVTGGAVPCNKGQTEGFIVRAQPDRNLEFTWFEYSQPANGITFDMFA